ncbi:hypothetical protein VTG60DRAFT_6878 [Thermothelomyces hinnuleus]
MAKLFISTILGLASLQGAMAAPKVYPEVIPGPGLPSLAQLNVTSAQLYEMGLPEELQARAQDLERRFVGKCGPAEAAYTSNTVMCKAGKAHVHGSAMTGRASSYCRDVASGVLWVVDSCTRPDQTCAGAQAAAGNATTRNHQALTLICLALSGAWAGRKVKPSCSDVTFNIPVVSQNVMFASPPDPDNTTDIVEFTRAIWRGTAPATNGTLTVSDTFIIQRPDPLAVVQPQLQIDLVHAVVAAARDPSAAALLHHPFPVPVGGRAFSSTVVLVGHSYGSFLAAALAAQYPADADALVLTGYSSHLDF